MKNAARLIDNLRAYAESAPVRFHMPGHKGITHDPALKSIYPYDVTELSFTDNLHSPSGVLKTLQNRFAALYSAKESFLLVNGSTAGNIAMLLSLGIGRRVLLGRGCHKSVLSGIALAGHEIVSLFPDEKLGTITPESVESVFAKEEEPFDAVFLTSPTYYGRVSDIERIAKAVHEHGAQLFVDAAHGAHYPYSAMLPPVPSYADAWVVSCHKTLGSMTQTAVLNLGKSASVSPLKMQGCLAMIQSSSPSYALMRSLELILDNPMDWDFHCKRILAFRRKLAGINGVKLYGAERFASSVTMDSVCAESNGALSEKLNFSMHNEAENPFTAETSVGRICRPKNEIDYDITRLVFSVRGVNGYSLSNRLESEGIYVEMSDPAVVVLITSPNDPDEWYERLFNAVSTLCRQNVKTTGTEISAEKVLKAKTAQTKSLKAKAVEYNASFPCCSNINFPRKQRVSVREAMLGSSREIPLSESEGEICAGAAWVYPPGAALIFPGEEIGRTELDMLKALRDMGADFLGIEKDMISVLDYQNKGK